MLDAAFELTTANIPPTYHFSIHGGVVYAKTRQPVSVYHDRLFDMLRTLARAVPLPDVEWVMHGWDHAKVWRQDPIPVFSFVRDAAKTDVTVPYPYVWGQGGFDFSFDSNCPRDWGNRSSSKVTWRGGCTGPAAGYQDVFAPLYLRYRATALTRPPVGGLDTGAGACNFKYLLLIDGNTASGRASLWAHAGAVLFKPDSVFSEWWYHTLVPWVHYVPIREYLEDAIEQAQWLLHEAPPTVAQCLRDNLAALSKQHVTRDAALCYWWRLLTTWAAQTPEGSRTEGFEPI